MTQVKIYNVDAMVHVQVSAEANNPEEAVMKGLNDEGYCCSIWDIEVKDYKVESDEEEE